MTRALLMALHVAADAIKEKDGGDMATETGWKSDELLDAWQEIMNAIDNYEPPDPPGWEGGFAENH
jgi:hypothetical protein